MDDRIGATFKASLIKVPDWVDNPLGKYYLYFADHRGTYIRMAYADEVTAHGLSTRREHLNWKTHSFPPPARPARWHRRIAALYPHIASPDVLVREDLRQIVMYYHGRGVGRQFTRAAVSSDGIRFEGREEDLGRATFESLNMKATTMPEHAGVLYRSRWTDCFEAGPQFFTADMRHSALLIRDNLLHVFFQTGVTHQSASCSQPSNLLRIGANGVRASRSRS